MINNDVTVFRVPWGQGPWRILCAHCECWTASHVRREDAYNEALAHAAKHEARRCEHCGRTS